MPAPELGLLTIDEPSPAQGTSFALGNDPSDGGKSLILTDGSPCGECCGGDCLTVSKWEACGQNQTTAPCSNDPTQVWICTGIGCGSGVVKWRNRCYRPAFPAVEIPIGNLNEGDILLSNRGGSDPDFNFTCLPSCNDPGCTECRTYLRCSPCGGDGFRTDGMPVSGGPPPAYIRRELVTCCGLAGNASNANGTGFCFTVGPGADAIREDQLPPGAAILTGPVVCNLDCCDSICAGAAGGCGGRATWPVYECSTGAEIIKNCCCPRTFLVAGEYHFSQTVRIPSVPGTYSTLTADGSWEREYQDGGPLGGAPTIQHHRVNYSNNVPVLDEHYGVPVPEWVCGRELGFPVVDYLSPDFVCPYQLPPESEIVVEFAVVLVGCNTAAARGSWKVWGPGGPGAGQPQRETTFEVRFTITARDPCGTNCGMNTATLAARARRGSKTPVLVSTGQPVQDGALPNGAPAAGLFFRG